MPDLPSSLRELIDGAAPAVDVDAVVGKRRRRRARRRVAVGGALVVAVAIATIGVATRPDPDRHVVAVQGHESEMSATQSALAKVTIFSPGGGSGALTSAPDTVTVTDPTSGSTHTVAFPIHGAQSIEYPFLSLGSNVVMTVDTQTGPYDAAIGTAYAASSDLKQWRAIAPASGAFASAESGRVWLVSDNATPDQRLHGVEYGAQRSVFEIGIDGNDRSDSYPLTDRRTPFADTGAGLLTARPAAAKSAPPVYEVWDPATNRVIRRLAIGGYAFSTSSRFVAWTAQSCPPLKPCALHLTDVQTGADRAIAPPAGLLWGEAAFSGDGSHVVVAAAPPPTRKEIESTSLVVPPGRRAVTLAVIDTAIGAEATRAATVWKGGLNLSWSADGALVFFARDRDHFGYFNASFAHGPVRGIDANDASESLVAEKPAAPSATAQRYSYDGPVRAETSHSAELCIYATAAVGVVGGSNDTCSGPLIAGWDPKAPGGKYHLVGTYDGHVFTLTQPPSAVQRRPSEGLPSFKTPCAPPPGGWQVTNPARVSFDDYNAFTNAARHDPEFAGLWIDQSTGRPGIPNDFERDVFNVGFTGHLDAHRSQLARLWGGPICVVARSVPYSRLQHISMQLVGATGRALGLQLLSSGPDDVRDVVQLDVVAADDATRRAIDAWFGAGVVRVSSRLQPVGG